MTSETFSRILLNRFAVRLTENGWFFPAFWIVAAITALRLGLLGFNRTDLFSDEA